MTGEKENKEFYQAAYREVHASEQLLRKVEAMGKEYHQKHGKKYCAEAVLQQQHWRWR